MKILPIFLSILALCYSRISSPSKGCQISIDTKSGDLKEPQPVILNFKKDGIIDPNEQGVVSFTPGQPITLVCPGKKNNLSLLSKSQMIQATCDRDKQFRINGKVHSFSSFTCTESAKSAAKESGTCLGKFSRVQVGFEIPGAFIPTIEICRDKRTDESIYAKSILSNSIGGNQHGNPRPSWATLNLFKLKNINNLYTKKSQEKVLAVILGSSTLAAKHLARNSLARGHLVPMADFVYGSEKDTTFTFANCAPQWFSFNSGNWEHMEKTVRNFVVATDKTVEVYTGVYGQMTMEDVHKKEQPIFLSIDPKYNGYIRVPKFYWKIIYDTATKTALAIVGVNDPFRGEIGKDMLLCKDLSDNPEALWLTKGWKERKNIWLGYIYVCSYQDLKKAVPTLPNLIVKGLLIGSSRTSKVLPKVLPHSISKKKIISKL